MNIVLASQSPRRKQILKEMGYSFIVQPAIQDEVFDVSLPLDQALIKVAFHKAMEVKQSYPDSLILAADTIVVFKNKILGKPKSEKEAFAILSALSGHKHEVKTGVAILYGTQQKNFVSTSHVQFRSLSETEILNYIQEKKPFDKAGSYGIQECDFVKEYDGEYETIVGLPKIALQKALNEMHLENL